MEGCEPGAGLGRETPFAGDEQKIRASKLPVQPARASSQPASSRAALPLSLTLSHASSLQSVKTFQCVLQIPCLQPPALSQINHVLGNTAGMY